MQVEEEGSPCSGLVFRHTGYDGDMYLSIAEMEGRREGVREGVREGGSEGGRE